MHHSFEKRLIVVESYQVGKSLSWIKLHLGVDEKQVRDWVALFRLYGENGLRHGHSNILGGAEKERIVRLAIEKGVGHPWAEMPNSSCSL